MGKIGAHKQINLIFADQLLGNFNGFPGFALVIAGNDFDFFTHYAAGLVYFLQGQLPAIAIWEGKAG